MEFDFDLRECGRRRTTESYLSYKLTKCSFGSGELKKVAASLRTFVIVPEEMKLNFSGTLLPFKVSYA